MEEQGERRITRLISTILNSMQGEENIDVGTALLAILGAKPVPYFASYLISASDTLKDHQALEAKMKRSKGFY